MEGGGGLSSKGNNKQKRSVLINGMEGDQDDGAGVGGCRPGLPP